MPEKTIYMIDGTAYIYRAFHAIRSLANSKGLPTNAVFGFSRMLIKLVQDRSPEHLIMFFDSRGPTFRHEMYKEYKANRPPMPEDLAVQIPLIKKVTEAFSIPIVEMPGYEADDLIGTMARLAEKEGCSVVMVSGDKDFVQLITERTVLWDPMKDKTTDLDAVREKFGVEPRQIIEVMGLSGDSADNVPGVRGVGPKTAITLIKTFGDMDALYERVDEITKKKQHENLVACKELAFLSRRLVTIDTEAPTSFDVESCKYTPPDNARLSELFKELEFRQLQQEFHQEAERPEKKYAPIMDEEALAELIRRLEAAEVFALDTETTSKSPMNARLVGLSFALEPHEAFYIPCKHDYLGVPDQLPRSRVLDLLRPVLENPDVHKVGQNIKYDWIVLERHGVRLAGVVFDTMLASYLINPTRRGHGLDQMAMDLFNYKMTSYKEVTAKVKGSFAGVPLEKAAPYACEDADLTLMASDVLKPRLEEAGLTTLMAEVEMPLAPVLKEMEMTGVCVDREKLKLLSSSFKDQLEDLDEEIYTLAGEHFNINSSQQLGKILFEKLGLPTQKKTRKKTGYSTDVDVLTKLADKHELPALVLRRRGLAKLKSTYTDALTGLVHPETGRIHTSYNQSVAATGRLSSSDPNLQNIPIRTEEGRWIREAFIPREGWRMLSADYSQIELRLLAHYSEDRILTQSFLDDEDIHTRTAAEVFHAFPTAITPELRRQAKAINFGIMYGMSAFGLSKQLGISRKMAKTFIDNYFSRYEGVKAYIDRTIREAGETQKTSTLLGRVRPLPEINSSNKNLRAFAERTAINTPIQGTAADLIKVAMIRMRDALEKEGCEAAMLMTVHDELIFEAPSAECDAVEGLVRKVMEGVWDLRVPLKVNMAWGDNWAEAH